MGYGDQRPVDSLFALNNLKNEADEPCEGQRRRGARVRSKSSKQWEAWGTNPRARHPLLFARSSFLFRFRHCPLFSQTHATRCYACPSSESLLTKVEWCCFPFPQSPSPVHTLSLARPAVSDQPGQSRQGGLTGEAVVWGPWTGGCFYQRALVMLVRLISLRDSTEILQPAMEYTSPNGIGDPGGDGAIGTTESMRKEERKKKEYGIFPPIGPERWVGETLSGCPASRSTNGQSSHFGTLEHAVINIRWRDKTNAPVTKAFWSESHHLTVHALKPATHCKKQPCKGFWTAFVKGGCRACTPDWTQQPPAGHVRKWLSSEHLGLER